MVKRTNTNTHPKLQKRKETNFWTFLVRFMAKLITYLSRGTQFALANFIIEQ